MRGLTDIYDTFVAERLPAGGDLPEFRFDLPAFHYPERFNAAAVLIDDAVAEGHGEHIAIVNHAGRWTYAAMADLSSRIARLLVEETGLRPGGRVLLAGPNSAMLFAAWLGILKSGGVAVTVMPLLRAGEIAKILAKAEVGHAIVDVACAEDVRAAAVQTGRAGTIISFSGDSGGGDLEQGIAAVAGGFAAYDSAADDPALIAFTSGTTGVPKGCVQYHRDILIPADGFARHLIAPGPGDVFACSAPIAFTFGLGGGLIFPLRFRATVVTLERASPASLLDAVAAFGVTILLTAPTAYREMVDRLDGRALPALRACVSAGEHLPAATWRRWHEATGCRIIDGIGATEMMHIFISAAGDDIRPGSTGRVVPGYTACVLDPDGRPLPEGTGQLAIKGPTGCRYLDDPRQRNYVSDGWNVTGDVYRLDADGYFWFVGRSDDMIVSAGYNIAAPEVENALLKHPAVVSCAVIGVPCDRRGQKVKAFVVPAADAAGDLVEQLQDHVKRELAPYKYPREIELVGILPTTANGKLQRYRLRERGG